MLTKKQILLINNFFIYPLYESSADYLGEDSSVSALTNGYCYYYANALEKILNAGISENEKKRIISTNAPKVLNGETPDEEWYGIAKICSRYSDHYFISYGDDYYDGNGLVQQDDENLYFNSMEKNQDKTEKSKIYYLGTTEKDDKLDICDADIGGTIDYYKTAVWNIYSVITDRFIKEMMEKIRNANEEDTENILRIYTSKAYDLFNNDPSTKSKIADIKKKRNEDDKNPELAQRFYGKGKNDDDDKNHRKNKNIDEQKKMGKRFYFELSTEEREAWSKEFSEINNDYREDDGLPTTDKERIKEKKKRIAELDEKFKLIR